MKNIVREVVAVSKTAILVGIIIVAAVVGAIAYLYWPRAVGVSASFVPEDGGTIQTTGKDGSVFTLSVSPHALFEEEKITLTPLEDIEGLPFTSGIVAAVRMEPEGLRFIQPVNLTIELPFSAPDNLVGFLVQSNGEGFHLCPIETNGNTISFSLMHFTGAGVATVSCEQIQAWDINTWLTQEDRAKQRIAILKSTVELCEGWVGSDDDVANALMGIHKDWFFDSGPPFGVQRMLMEAQSDPEGFLMRAVSQLNSWYWSLMQAYVFNLKDSTGIEVYGIDLIDLPQAIDCGDPEGFLCEDLGDVAEAASAKFFEAFKKAVTNANNRCINEGQNQDEEALGLIEKAVWLECDVNGDLFGLYDKYFDSEGLVALKSCGIWSLEIQPASDTIGISDNIQLKAFAKDKQGNILREINPTELHWYDYNKDVATVNEYGMVTAVGEGTAKFLAKIFIHCLPLYEAEAEITVTSEEEPEEPDEPTEPDEKPESGDKYEVTWKATTSVHGECVTESGIGYRELQTWEAIGIFEGYAEIIYEGWNPETNKTSRVTDFWVNGFFEQYVHEEPLNMEYMYQPGCRRVKHNITEEGAEYIKNFLEERFFVATDKCIYIFVYLFDDESKDYSFFGRRYAEEYMSWLHANYTHLIENNCTELKYQWIGAGKYRKFQYMGNPGIICFDETRQTYFKTIDIAEPDRMLPYWVDYTTPYVHWEIEVKPLNEPADLPVGSLMDAQMEYSLSYRDIDVEKAYNMITSNANPNVVVLDVRTQSEYESGHIDGAVWIPVDELEARIGELAVHKIHEIVVYCGSGVRSVTASEILRSHGFTEVKNMVGGISAWQSAGYSLNPERVPPSPPLWTQWWFWATVVSGITVLTGAVYCLKSRKHACKL